MEFNRSAEEEEQLKALRRQRFSNTEGERRYRQLVEARAKRREQLTAQGRLGRGGSLSSAIKIVGTCTLMCPEFEREERELKKNLAPQELVPGTRKADPQRTVKTFHRSAAGNEEPLPEDLRTPDTLLRTLDHLVDAVIGGDQTLRSCHGFVRDRTRSIRQDFTIQNIRDHRTVAACERIARFHIVSLHVLCGHKEFEEQQDMEQLRNTLKTLIELYDDRRKAGEPSPNEAEFYAYYIVAHLRDSDPKRVAERLPSHIFCAPVVQQALRLHMMSESSGTVTSRQDPGNQFAAQNLAAQFFRAVASPKTPFLLACLAEYRFPSIRRAALKAMNTAFPFQEGKEYPCEEFAAMLAFDSIGELTEFCALFNVTVDERGVRLGERAGRQLVFREPEQKLRRTKPNLRVVGAKLHSSLMHVINTPLDQDMLAPTRLSTSARPAQGIPRLAPQPTSVFQSPMSASKPTTVSMAPPAVPFGGTPASAVAAASQSGVSAAAARFGSSQNAAQPFSFKSASQPAAFVPDAQAKQGGSAPFSALFSGTKKPVKSVSFAPTLAADASKGSAHAASANGQQTPLSTINSSNSSVAVSAGPSPLSVSAPSIFASTSAAAVASTSTSQGLPTAKLPAGAFTMSPAKPFSGSAAEAQLPDSGAALTPQPSQQPLQQAVQGSPAAKVVWNRPRMRINWTSLTNALYANLIDSLVSEIGQPMVQRAQKHSKVALALSEDIADAIVSYTSAFMVYEESYRCLLFAQADSFRRRSALGKAFSRWSMESVAKQQDRALQQQYMDDLSRMADSEYIGQKQAFSGMSSSPMPKAQGISRDLPLASNGPYVQASSTPASLPPDFWESLHLGRENFDAVCRVLKRYGSPSLESLVQVSGAQDMTALSSWLWWQIDPSAVSAPSQSARSAVYSKVFRQRKAITLQRIKVCEAADDEDEEDIGARRVSAMIVLLSPEPVTSSDLRGDLDSTPLGARIKALVSGSLGRIRRQVPLGHANESVPVLNVFWCSDAKATKAVRRFIEYVVSTNGVPPNIAMHTLALDVTKAKGQFAAGIKWLFRQVAQSRRRLLVRVSYAYDPVVGSMLQMLFRLRGCITGLLEQRVIDDSSAISVFNKAVDIANAFIDVVNQLLLSMADLQPALRFPQATTLSGTGWGYFGHLPFVSNAVARATLDQVLFGSSDNHQHSSPSLGACLSALEFAAKHQMDFIQHSIPSSSSSSAYVDRHDVAEAVETAAGVAEQLVVQAAQLCQQMVVAENDQRAMFMTPKPKRPSSLAFGEFVEPLPPVAGMLGPPSPNTTTASFRTTSPSSVYTESTQNSPMLAACKRHRPDSSSSRLSRLQMAISRARKQLEN
ncbi:actin cytoskeleton and mitosis protein [Coemansia sp. RSA 2599]|nr:actin cytoskeleton and mitosis protein [Coemansia sp. RSA 2598]KAJ1826711.1 actin cytoskeleton and mitosis protein [Coemansia sp. RSA 2599]